MFGTKEKAVETTYNAPTVPVENTYKRKKLLITPEQIQDLSTLLSKANSVGFEMAVQVENDGLVLKFKNDLISIDSDEFVCKNVMDVPTGPEASENVSKFAKTYLPGEEIKKLQREILDRNEALTSENVKEIEDRIANTVKSINSLANVLSSMPVKEEKVDPMEETMPIPVIKDTEKEEKKGK